MSRHILKDIPNKQASFVCAGCAKQGIAHTDTHMHTHSLTSAGGFWQNRDGGALGSVCASKHGEDQAACEGIRGGKTGEGWGIGFYGATHMCAVCM
jgi:hypothetical protein